MIRKQHQFWNETHDFTTCIHEQYDEQRLRHCAEIDLKNKLY